MKNPFIIFINTIFCNKSSLHNIVFFRKNKCDYAYNHVPKNNKYPDGLGAEICSMATLKLIKEKATTFKHKEHLFDYIWSYSSNYSIKTFDPPENLSYPGLRLDVDTMVDYKFLLSRDYKVNMNAEEIVKISTDSMMKK